MRVAATVLLVGVGSLLSLGLVMAFSASMTVGGGVYPVHAFAYLAVGILGCWVAASLDYRDLKRVSWLLWLVAVLLLVAVLIVGPEWNAARRWLDLGPVSFQPSELAKLAVVIALAHYLERYRRELSSVRGGLIVPGVFVGLVLFLIFRQPDWGATILLAAVSGILLLVGGVRWLHLTLAGGVGLAGLGAMLIQDPVRWRRVLSWLDIEASKGEGGWQTWQSILAFGSGGWKGMGLGDGLNKYGYVPEHETDFIFPVIGQELGLVFTMGVLGAFVVVVLCGLYIAWHARDPFGMYLATGLTFLIGLQAFINMGVVTNLLPNKGLPLPFISRGGSNLVVLLMAVGLLVSVARRAAVSEAREGIVADWEEGLATQEP
jgi:cell division protein FtsW